MSFVYVPGSSAQLPYQVPDASCCNCGATDNLSLIETPLKKTRYFVLAGTELRFHANFPYCGSCIHTASRFPVSFAKKLLVAFGIFWALMLLVVFIPNDLARLLPGVYLPLAIGILAWLFVLALYALRKTRPPQTSYYQPVTLKGLKQKFTGDIVSIELQFSNAQYAGQFTSLNQELISSGALKVSHT